MNGGGWSGLIYVSSWLRRGAEWTGPVTDCTHCMAELMVSCVVVWLYIRRLSVVTRTRLLYYRVFRLIVVWCHKEKTRQAKFRFIQVHILTRGYGDKLHALLVSVSDFGRKRMVSFGVILVSAESRIPLSAWLLVSAETEILLLVGLYLAEHLLRTRPLQIWPPLISL